MPKTYGYKANLLAAATLILIVGLTVFAMLRQQSVQPGNPKLQGGQTSYLNRSYDANPENAFSLPAANLSFEERSQFAIGNAIFRRVWVSAPASTKSTDGLGPLFNARSCQRCHIKDGRGHPPEMNFPEDNAVSLLLRLSVDSDQKERDTMKIDSLEHPVLGGQLQDFSTQGIPSEGKIHMKRTYKNFVYPDGSKATLEIPTYSIHHTSLENDKILISPRVAQPMIGLGLLEAIPWKRLEKLADANDQNKDGISGRIPLVWVPSGTRVKGRFGWKATQPDIRSQVRGAFLGDMGLSTGASRQHWGDCTVNQKACRNALHGADKQAPEVDPKMEAMVVFYSKHLAVPARRNSGDSGVIEGENLFKSIGCAKCHTPSHTTSADWPEKALRGQKIYPYSDLLVHDMGEALSDQRPVANLSGSEWRTPPLWGIGYTQQVNGHTRFLHDGRARNLEEAILWHGGEAAESQRNFARLSKVKRSQVLSFLESL